MLSQEMCNLSGTLTDVQVSADNFMLLLQMC